MRLGRSNGLPTGPSSISRRSSYVGPGTEDVLDGWCMSGNYLAGEAGAVRHGDITKVMGGLPQQDDGCHEREVPEGEVKFVSSEVDGSLWYILVGERRAGAIICYVDDLLIAGEPAVAKEAAQMISRTWKCTEPQWDDVSFNGFEIHRTEEGMILGQDSYTKDLLGATKTWMGMKKCLHPPRRLPRTSRFEMRRTLRPT